MHAPFSTRSVSSHRHTRPHITGKYYLHRFPKRSLIYRPRKLARRRNRPNNRSQNEFLISAEGRKPRPLLCVSTRHYRERERDGALLTANRIFDIVIGQTLAGRFYLTLRSYRKIGNRRAPVVFDSVRCCVRTAAIRYIRIYTRACNIGNILLNSIKLFARDGASLANWRK